MSASSCSSFSNNNNNNDWPVQELFGGAIVIQLPSCFVNVSDVRQVPDNQEVFVDDSSGCSVIVELLERAEQASDDDAIKFHFREIADTNQATDASIREIFDRRNDDEEHGSFAQLLSGSQKVAKFNETGNENDVAIVLGMRRFPAPISTDILVSVSYAYNIAPGSSDNKQWDRTLSPQDVQELGIRAFDSLKILDYGLFVHSAE